MYAGYNGKLRTCLTGLLLMQIELAPTTKKCHFFVLFIWFCLVSELVVQYSCGLI